ncbi:MAG: adenylate/guanylate cyclase domain-containing protein [Proteobacteria bacterium]|nr:adenylate/guanylate cyclase domain-containing protein [Pseudomonadota bacterium]
MSATSAEIAALRRRYLWRATSVAFLSITINVIYVAATGAWPILWRSAGIGLLLLFGVNGLIARQLFEPIRRFLCGEIAFDDIQRRLTQLPLLTARYVGLLSIVVVAFQTSTPWWIPSVRLILPPPAIADFVTICIVLPIFFFTYTYFVVSDYLAGLCEFIFARYGLNLGLFFGSYTAKLLVALLVISVAPLATIVVHLFSYDGERLQLDILVDVASAVLGVAISAYFISRSLLRPINALSRAMTNAAEGDLSVRVAVTSNDEVGELTGRFNDMVEGLREREQIRATFGRYVDENVAAAILRRQGDGQRSGEIGEATILFTDIANFTTIAEYLAPHELVGVLNDYLETVLAPIRNHGGVVNTFIGDGLFASFNMPLACTDHAVAAVQAAIDIQCAVGSRTFGEAGVALPTRIGISTGPVIGGDVGTGRRVSFTLLGETVNLASRLEELNKKHGTRILVASSTCAACGHRFAFQSLGPVAVRGLSESVMVYSIDPSQQGGQQPSV